MFRTVSLFLVLGNVSMANDFQVAFQRTVNDEGSVEISRHLIRSNERSPRAMCAELNGKSIAFVISFYNWCCSVS